MLFSKNIGESLAIDEVSLSKGELYTYLTNKAGKGKKGTIVASIKGTKSKDIIEIIKKIPLSERIKVKEVTLDMANNMEASIRASFPNASLVIDRFHVVKLVLDALQHLRVSYRWEVIEKENIKIEEAKKKKQKFIATVLSNGDTPRQLLARSRYILAKKETDYTENQKERATILFREYPELKKGYNHCMKLRNIYECKAKSDATIRLNQWIKESKQMEIIHFNTAAKTIEKNKENILNFFDNRSTNANAESFNSKIKLFRANLRGVTDVKFFLFRLAKLFG